MLLDKSRRKFVNQCAVYALGFSGLQNLLGKEIRSKENNVNGYGPLIKDPAKILDLPKDFSYKIIGRSGELMSDGLYLPDKPDGMATFSSSQNKDVVILIRNHEINPLTFGVNGPFGKKIAKFL